MRNPWVELATRRGVGGRPGARGFHVAGRSIRRVAPAVLLVALAIAGGCRSFEGSSSAAPAATLAAAPRAVPPGGWRTSVEADHPLVGRLWDTAHARFLGESELAARLAASRFVLLGEKHDNADHHRLEALAIQRLVAAGPRPAVAFEMLTPDQAPALERLLARPKPTPAELRKAVGWDASGWPAWPLYEPVFAAALKARLPIAAANLSEHELSRMRHHGVDGLDAATRKRLGLDQPLPPKQREAMTGEIRKAHCGAAPEDELPLMVDVQRARDGAMAAALERAVSRPEVDGAVLVAGTGHVRQDRGVPWHLREAGVPGAAVVSLAFLEVPTPESASGQHPSGGERPPSEGSSEATPAPPLTDPARDLAARFGSSRAFDYVWYTPRVDALDPCTHFRRELQRMRQLKPPPHGPDAPGRPTHPRGS